MKEYLWICGLLAIMPLTRQSLAADDQAGGHSTLQNPEGSASIRRAEVVTDETDPGGVLVAIEYYAARNEPVSLKMFNILGTEVLSTGEQAQRAGVHTVWLDATGLPRGVYICRLQSGSRVCARTLVLLQS